MFPKQVEDGWLPSQCRGVTPRAVIGQAATPVGTTRRTCNPFSFCFIRGTTTCMREQQAAQAAQDPGNVQHTDVVMTTSLRRKVVAMEDARVNPSLRAVAKGMPMQVHDPPSCSSLSSRLLL